MNEWLNEWVKEGRNEWVNEWMNEWLNEWMNEWNRMTDWLNEWMNESNDWLTEWLTDWMNEWVSDWMIEWLNDWMIDWMNEWMDGWTNEWMNQSLNQFINQSFNCQTSSSKSALKPAVFNIFMWDRALATVSCAFCPANSTTQKRPLRTCQFFFTVFMWNRALAKVSCTFWRPHLPKVLPKRQFFDDFYLKPISRYSLVRMLPTPSSKRAPNVTVFQMQIEPVRFLSTTFQDRGPHPRKQRPHFGDHGYPKKEGSRSRIFSSLNLRVPELLHCYTSDDDVVDMMMWLTLYIIYTMWLLW